MIRLVAYAINGTAEAITISSIVGRANDSQGVREFLESALEMPVEELFDKWRPVMDHALRYADKAVELAGKLT